jgi:hypothetical protein
MPAQTARVLIHNKSGVRLFRTPHAGFDPLQADTKQLLVCGYPAAPSAATRPRLYELWRSKVTIGTSASNRSSWSIPA